MARRETQEFYNAIREIIYNRIMVEIASETAGRLLPEWTRMGEEAKLWFVMFKNFAYPGRVMEVMANFLKWAPDQSPDRQEGDSFENKYFDISVGEGK